MFFHNIEHNTTPIVIHHTGDMRRFFYYMRSSIISSKRRYKASNPDITIFTWNNKPRKGFFEVSLDSLGLDYLVLGKEVIKWSNIIKIALSHEFLKGVDTPYVMAADSRDVLLLDYPSRVIERMESLPRCSMLFNAERDHYPPRCPTKAFEKEVFERSTTKMTQPGSKPFQYLNSGVWVGRTEFCRALHEEALEVKPPLSSDDQGVYKILYKRYYPSIQIDHDCEVFQTLWMMKPAEFKIIE